MDYPKSYYVATQNSQTSFDPLEESIEVETCIIGGGYAGLMTQLGLLQRGQKNVALLEQHKIGWGASGRNGGFVFAGYSLSPEVMVKQVGRESTRELYKLTVDAVNLIRQRIADFAIKCDQVDQGAVWVNWFKDQDVLFRSQSFMREVLGVEWDYLAPDKLYSLIKSERYSGGLLEPNAMHFHPLNYACGIAKINEGKGGQLFENSTVTSIKSHSTHMEVITDRGKVRCQQLVVCGGGYVGDQIPKISQAILPISTYIMVTEPLPENCADQLHTQAAIYDSRFAFDYYRKLNDGRLLWGGRISADTKTPLNLEKKLRRDLARVFPKLATAKVDFIWDGWMGYSKHQMPCIGKLDNRIWYNLGFGGHGVAPTTVGGELIASAIVGGDDRYRLFQPWGLPWAGGKLGPLAAQSSYWWYQLQDWFKEGLEKMIVRN